MESVAFLPALLTEGRRRGIGPETEWASALFRPAGTALLAGWAADALAQSPSASAAARNCGSLRGWNRCFVPATPKSPLMQNGFVPWAEETICARLS